MYPLRLVMKQGSWFKPVPNLSAPPPRQCRRKFWMKKTGRPTIHHFIEQLLLPERLDHECGQVVLRSVRHMLG